MDRNSPSHALKSKGCLSLMSTAVRKRKKKANTCMSITEIATNHGKEARFGASPPLQPSFN